MRSAVESALREREEILRIEYDQMVNDKIRGVMVSYIFF